MFTSRISHTLSTVRPSVRSTLRTYATSGSGRPNERRVAGGLKGTLHNPNTSPAAKEHASERLEELSGSTAESAQHKNHVLGGYKATLTNQRSSEEAKKHAREVLEAQGIQLDAAEGVAAAEHEKRVVAGYKAALHNPRVSEDAKRHAKEYLKEHNVQ